MFAIRKTMIAGWAACAIFGATAEAASHAPKAASAPLAANADATANATAASSPVSLATYANLSGPMRIVGASASRSVSVPVSAREAVRGATLHLVASNSVSLLGERSQLVVRVNDRAIAQFPLSPRQPELTADIRVPAELLRAGYNNLTFQVAQHSTENCEEPNAPELWTEVDTSASTFAVDTELRPLTSTPPQLATLDDLIDPKQNAQRSIAIVNAVHPVTDSQLSSGGLLAQGVALRLRYRNADLRVLDAQAGEGAGMLRGLDLASLANADVLLIGKRDTLAPYLDAAMLERIGGAFLGVYPKPDDPRHFVLLVAGRTDEEVNLAARVFSHAELPLPRRAEMTADGLTEARMDGAKGGDALSGTKPYSLRDLGFRSTTLGVGSSADVALTLPADAYAPENAQAVLTLNFAEGARMRSDSVLNLYLNDRFVQAVALDQQQGAVVNRYRVSVPLQRFQPGANVLSLRPVLVPLVTDRCTLRQSANLQLSLFDDSTIELPPMLHFTNLPDLRRFAESGFPYTRRANGADLAIQLNARDDDTLNAAWSLLGKLAQKQGRPLTAAQITAGVPGVGRQTIVVGAGAELPRAALNGAPWAPGKSMRFASNEPAPAEPTLADSIWARVAGVFGKPAYAADVAPDMVLDGDMKLSRQLLVMQYRSAASKTTATTTLLTAATPAELLHGVQQLIAPQHWGSLDGDVSVVSFDSDALWTTRVSRRYEVGEIGAFDHIGYEVSAHPGMAYGVLAGALAMLAALTALLLRRYHRKHHVDSRS
ncbi:cellulose biosynthesis cyclic di-GMP-binding regulatory protein BcsB [Caballeronia sp. GAWG1-1]|uniref:cellulose biosynthesis cyclic di-GMP-binding regulatory protein BcsB n=2 Tax=unclassified Caballeronia TaxID=2646786 RepID=UPI00202780AD|nr:cellulose biosynthesis cyclic di-GMP-binding regulatory protein BcsB [Caballeronia sp. GAWG1-1]